VSKFKVLNYEEGNLFWIATQEVEVPEDVKVLKENLTYDEAVKFTAKQKRYNIRVR